MFDFGFLELVVIGVVALIVIGPERLPKVARTAGLLYGRMQRYVSSVKSDISNEIQLDEMRRVGQDFKASVESAVSGVEQQATQQATVVDDYLRDEASSVKKMVAAMAETEGERSVTEPAMKQIEAAQQSLPLEEPDQNSATPAPSVAEKAHAEAVGKPT